MCKLSSLQRYDAKRALKHPWITRNFQEKIPLTRIEEMQHQDAHHTFARLTRLATFLSIIKQHNTGMAESDLDPSYVRKLKTQRQHQQSEAPSRLTDTQLLTMTMTTNSFDLPKANFLP